MFVIYIILFFIQKTSDVVLGTLAWMAPELFSFRPKYNTKTDMYPFLIIFFFPYFSNFNFYQFKIRLWNFDVGGWDTRTSI
jgi:serine/threonine protein kinase